MKFYCVQARMLILNFQLEYCCKISFDALLLYSHRNSSSPFCNWLWKCSCPERLRKRWASMQLVPVWRTDASRISMPSPRRRVRDAWPLPMPPRDIYNRWHSRWRSTRCDCTRERSSSIANKRWSSVGSRWWPNAGLCSAIWFVLVNSRLAPSININVYSLRLCRLGPACASGTSRGGPSFGCIQTLRLSGMACDRYGRDVAERHGSEGAAPPAIHS